PGKVARLSGVVRAQLGRARRLPERPVVAQGRRDRAGLAQLRGSRPGPARHPDRRPRFERRVLGRPRQTVFCGVHRSRAQAFPARAVSRVMSFKLPRRARVTLAPGEHTAFAWLPWREAARRCFSWSNRDAIVMLGEGAVIT